MPFVVAGQDQLVVDAGDVRRQLGIHGDMPGNLLPGRLGRGRVVFPLARHGVGDARRMAG